MSEKSLPAPLLDLGSVVNTGTATIARDWRGLAWWQLRLFAVMLIWPLVMGFLSAGSKTELWGVGLLGGLMTLALMSTWMFLRPIWLAVCIRSCRGEAATMGTRIAYASGLVTLVLYWLFIACGACALVIPGIIFAVRLSLAPYLSVDQGRSPIKALVESWELTRSLSWPLFGIGIVLGVIAAMCHVVPIVGGVFSDILYSVFSAGLYLQIVEQQSKRLQPSSPVAG